MIERQELYCHECRNYVQFDIDIELDGNHVLECPECGHEHCRIVKKGIVTEARWDSKNKQAYLLIDTSSAPVYTASNGFTYYVSSSTTGVSSVSFYDSYIQSQTSSTTAGTFLCDSWINFGR